MISRLILLSWRAIPIRASLTALNTRIRASSAVPLVAVKLQGLAGFIFNDFGDHFDVEDVTGEPGKDVPLYSASKTGRGMGSKPSVHRGGDLGLGIDDHFDVVLEAAGSGENASAASVTGLKVKISK